MTDNGLALYIHWPYCVSKCPYCDFNSHVGDTQNQGIWREAYRAELEYYAARAKDRPITSIFFGGGTPSLMEPQTVESVLNDAARLWSFHPDIEITLEANPSSAEAEKFAAFRNAGVNRLSLGIQSLQDNTLKFFERAHNANEARGALALAAKHFPRFSFDLIYAYQGQTLAQWRDELLTALPYAQGHLSLYQLTIEPHTRFHTRTRRGEVLTAAETATADMYEATQEIMERHGMPAYEISNHAAPGQESRHNLAYWHYDDYIGIGPGAHGRLVESGIRSARENHRAPDIWREQVTKQGHGIKTTEILDDATAMREAVMMGLRLTEGLAFARWNKKFATPLSEILDADKIARLIKEGLMQASPSSLHATRDGLEKLNAILDYLL